MLKMLKMTRVFRTSIITQLNKIKKNFLTSNGKFNQKFYKKIGTCSLY